jgi:hypothetical protein
MRTEIGERLKQQGFRLDLHGAFLRRVDLNKVDLENANFAGADAKNASFRDSFFKNADLGGTNLEGADLRGADLSEARNLTAEQLVKAVIDHTTKLPENVVAKLESLRQSEPPADLGDIPAFLCKQEHQASDT